MRLSSSRGNAVFLVLMAIVLMAALTYAITRGSRGSTNFANREQARLYADEIAEYGNGLRPIIDRMILLGGVVDTNISFAATGANAAYGVVGASTATEVFNMSGGTAVYRRPLPAVCKGTCAYEFSGQYTITDVGTSEPELSMLLVDIDQAVCQMLNVIARGTTAIPTGTALTTLARFDGSTYGAATAITLAGQFTGRRAFCYQEATGAARYIYVHVLRAR